MTLEVKHRRQKESSKPMIITEVCSWSELKDFMQRLGRNFYQSRLTVHAHENPKI